MLPVFISEQTLVEISAVMIVMFYRCLGIHVTLHTAIGHCVKRDVIHKTGSTWRIATPPEEDRATATSIMHKSMVKFGRAVFELCERTNRQTDKHIYS